MLMGNRLSRVTPFLDQALQAGGSAPPPAPQQTPPVKARPMMGRMGSGRGPTFWQWLTLGPEAPDVLQQRRMRDMQMSALEQRQKLDSQAQTDLNAAIGQLPPEMQPFARVAPEAAISSMFRQERAAPEPHYDSGTGNFWGVDPTTGEPRIMGRMPGWQRTQGAGGDRQPPPGYRWTQDGNLEAIPGGPAAFREGQANLRVTQQQRQRGAALMARLDNTQVVMGAIRRARTLAGSGETGMIGNVMRAVPGTNAYNLRATIDIIKSNLGFDALAEMRANSPTGGALGNVSERETELLQSMVDSLDQAQSTEQFNDALDRLERTYAQSMARIRAAYEQDFGTDPMAPQQGGQGQTLRYDPATGEFH